MRMNLLKRAHDIGVFGEDLTKISLEDTLKRLQEEDLTYEERVEEIELLKKELKNLETANKLKIPYVKRKEWNQGYLVGVGGSIAGFLLGEVISKLMKK